VSSYLASANAAIFWLDHGLGGMMFWGRPDSADIEMVSAALREDQAPSPRRDASLVDLRGLESVDLGAFARLSSALAVQRSHECERAARQAVLPPEGPAGALAAAVFATLNQRCSSRSFAVASEALEWIGVRDPSMVVELERIRDALRGPPVIDALRTQLDGARASTAREAALKIGISQRTLQRRLRECGTNYQREANLARLEVAKRLLRTTDQPLKWIALEAGYGSPQHFSASFRKYTRMSPSRWRAERQQ
jgi:AraC-like DNA-binding protein